MDLAVLPLAVAAAAVATCLVYPRADRAGWAAATILVGGWAALAGEPLAGAILAVAAIAAAAIDRRAEPVPTDFNSTLGRLLVLGAAVFGAVVLVVRLLALDAGLNPGLVLLSAVGIAALLHMTARPGPAAEGRAARAALAAGAAGWAVTSHPGPGAVATVALVLVLLAVAGRGTRGRLEGRVPAWIPASGLLLFGVVAVLLPPDASIGSGNAGLSLRGLSRASVLATAWALGAALLAAGRTGERSWSGPGLVAALAVAIALLRLPLGVAGLLLLAAITLPRLGAGEGAGGWSRTLVLGAAGAGAAAGAGVVGRLQGDDLIAAALLLGFLSLAAAAPFGWHVRRWMEASSPEMAALVGCALLPAAVAALVSVQPALAQVHAAGRAGLVMGLLGAVTAILGGLHAMGARDWRSLAIRTVPCEVGLALVGVAAFDIGGLQGAALTLVLLAVTRPVLLYAEVLGPRRGAGLAVTAIALLGAAGLPPTLGFAARLLVLSAATRIGPGVAALATTAAVLEVAAIAVVLRRRLGQPAGPIEPGDTLAMRTLAATTALAVLGGGIVPGLVLHHVLQLGS